MNRNPYDKNRRCPGTNYKNNMNPYSFVKNPYHKNMNNNFIRNSEDGTKEKYRKRKHKNKPWTKIPKPIKTSEVHQEICPSLKWCKEDALKALELERDNNRHLSTQYVLRFPDPILDKSIIHGFSKGIIDVRVQQPITPRYVYIQLNPDLDPEVLKTEISRISFGSGLLNLEKRSCTNQDEQKPEDVDPFTIFLGNIHPSTSIHTIKQKVQKAHRVDVGFAKKHKFGRYAFVKFRTAADAREAFTMLSQSNASDDGMDLVVRFRRIRGHIKHTNDDVDTTNKTETPKTPEETFETQVERITNDLLNNNDLNWDKLRHVTQQQGTKKVLICDELRCDTVVMGDDLDEIFDQINSKLYDDLDFC